MESDKRYDVFISYSTNDKKVAEGVCGYLERFGIRCFVSFRDIPEGADWADCLGNALPDSKTMVAIYSDYFNKSEETTKEINIADQLHIPILPFRLADVPYEGAKMYRLAHRNWIDAFPNPENHFGALLEGIEKLLGTTHAKTPVFSNPLNDDFEFQYENGVSSFLRYELQEAFNDLIEPAIHDYRDARKYLTDTFYSRPRLFHIPDDSFDYVKERADEGNAFAQFVMARYYEIKKLDYKKNFYYAEASAAQGDIYGTFHLAKCHELGFGTKKDLHEYQRLISIAFRKKCPLAILDQAKQYLWGWSFKKNATKAMELLNLAMQLGIPESFRLMGDIYFDGNHVQKSNEEAIRLYQQAIEKGHYEAYCCIAQAFLFDPADWSFINDPNGNKKALEALYKGVEASEPDCISQLALLYHFGNVLRQDFGHAQRLYAKAFHFGDRHSAFMMGYMHYNGEGGDIDLKKAWEWFSKGASMEENRCEWMLGRMCLEESAPVGYTQAECIKHFEKAAFLCGTGGSSALLDMYEIYRSEGLEDAIKYDKAYHTEYKEYAWAKKNDDKAMDCLRRSADLDNDTALYKAGCILTDIGSPFIDEVKGLKYLEAAIGKGITEAALQMAILYSSPKSCVPNDEDTANHYFGLFEAGNPETTMETYSGRLFAGDHRMRFPATRFYEKHAIELSAKWKSTYIEAIRPGINAERDSSILGRNYAKASAGSEIPLGEKKLMEAWNNAAKAAKATGINGYNTLPSSYFHPFISKDKLIQIANALADLWKTVKAKHPKLSKYCILDDDPILDYAESLKDDDQIGLLVSIVEVKIELDNTIMDQDEAAAKAQPTIGRNDPCPCGSGKKYKNCHGAGKA